MRELERLDKLSHDLWIEKTDLLWYHSHCEDCMSLIYIEYSRIQKRLDYIRKVYKNDDLGSLNVDAEKYYYVVKNFFEEVQRKFDIR